MKTQAEMIAKFGNTMVATQRKKFEPAYMVSWDVPDDINAIIRPLPNRIYCNKLIVEPLEKVFRELIRTGLYKEIKQWDGCYNPRFQRGSTTKISEHAWGTAVDLNAAQNPLGGKVTWTPAFVKVWRDLGWNCGADWTSRKDGMHFSWNKF
jgi:hypothetical protein